MESVLLIIFLYKIAKLGNENLLKNKENITK